MTPQQRMDPLAEAEGEAERLRDEVKLEGELDQGPFVEFLRCEDCSAKIRTSRETVAKRWEEHREERGCSTYTLAFRATFVDGREWDA